MILLDEDIKIAGDKPSKEIKMNKSPTQTAVHSASVTNAAKEWGRLVAAKFIEDAKSNSNAENFDYEMIIQRRLLLSFTATIGFEQFCNDDTLSGIAQKSFIDAVRVYDNDLYLTLSDTGAFSFYYLAFRRGGDIERRMGQTFAMLCSHDGDPIYQELGEVLYCWFLSIVKKSAITAKVE